MSTKPFPVRPQLLALAAALACGGAQAQTSAPANAGAEPAAAPAAAASTTTPSTTPSNTPSTTPAATPAATRSATVQEVVVTAQKVVELPRKIPLSITALAGDDLADAGVKNMLDLKGMVTSVNIIDQGPGASVQIRGIGSNPGGGNVDPSAAYSVDGVYQSRSGGAFGAMYDLQRVEVLKGPQGTLYGRNATVGAINVISNNPGKRFEAQVDGEVGSYQLRRVGGMLNLPVNDVVQVRLAGQAIKRDGYLSDGYNDADDLAARMKVLVKPDAQSSLLLTLDGHRKGGNGQGNIFTGTVTNSGLNRNGLVDAGASFSQTHTPRRDDNADPWHLTPSTLTAANIGTTAADATGHAEPANQGLKIRNDGVTLEYTRQVGDATLTVLPALRTSYVLNQGSTGGNLVQPAYNEIDQQQRSLEARLFSNPTLPLRWIAGVYYLDEDAPTTTISRAQAGTNTTITRMTEVKASSSAVFGQVGLPVAEATRLTGGLRYTRDDKRQAGSIYQLSGLTLDPSATNYTRSGAPISADGRYSSSAVDYKLVLDQRLAEDSMAYANLSSGYKAGGLNFDGAGGARQTYSPEKLLALALGAKHRGLGGRLQLNTEFFYWRYKNQQIAVLDQLDAPGALRGSAFSNLLFINNSGTSKLYGLDLDAVFMATPDDRLNASLTWTRARNGRFVTSQTVGGDIVVPGVGNLGAPAFQAAVDLSGQVMPFSPTLQLNLGYAHTFALSNGATLTAGTDWHLESHSYVNYNLFSPERQSGYGKGNLTLNYTSANGKTTVVGYVRNVSNVAVLTRGSVLGSVGGSIAHYAGIADPRTVGLSLSQRF